MKLDPAVLGSLTALYEPVDFVRVTRMAFAKTPLGMGYGQTRFACPDKTFQVLYIGKDLETGVAETIVRDRFQEKARRELERSEIDLWGVTAVTATAPLALIDLRKTGLLRLGVSTEAAKGKRQSQGRKLSKAVYHSTDFDGFLYLSRLTGEACVCVFDRAVPHLSPTPVEPLLRHPGLIPALTGLEVRLEAAP